MISFFCLSERRIRRLLNCMRLLAVSDFLNDFFCKLSAMVFIVPQKYSYQNLCVLTSHFLLQNMRNLGSLGVFSASITDKNKLNPFEESILMAVP